MVTVLCHDGDDKVCETAALFRSRYRDNVNRPIRLLDTISTGAGF